MKRWWRSRWPGGCCFSRWRWFCIGERLWRWPRTATGVLLLVVPLGNTSFLGVPMVQAFFGAKGIPFLIVYDQFGTMLIFATYGSLILALYGREGAVRLSVVAGRVLLFPPTMALLAGLLHRPWPIRRRWWLSCRGSPPP